MLSKAKVNSGKLLLILQISLKGKYKYTFVANLKIMFNHEFHNSFQKFLF